jgi:virulence-associated protein VagC
MERKEEQILNVKLQDEVVLKTVQTVEENIKLIFTNGLVLIGKYEDKDKKLFDVLQVIITPIPQQTENVNSLAQQQRIAYQFVPFLMGLADGEKGIIKELDLNTLNGNYLVIEPNSKIKDDYTKLTLALKTGIILDKKPTDLINKENPQT